jgi:cytoskeletal protein CcmA (bactofilin family)
LPTKLSQFTDDVVSGNYLPIKGIAEGAKTLKGLATSSSWIVAAGNGFNVYNNSSTKRCWFGFSLPEGSPYATTKWVFGASDSSGRADGEVYAKHISIGYGDDIATGGYALRANGNAKIDGTLTLDGNLIVKGGFRALNPLSYNGEVAHSILNHEVSPYGLLTRIFGNGSVSLQAQREDTTSEYFNLLLNHLGGNVAIGGTTADERLHVWGNARVTGNIAAQSATVNGGLISYDANLKAFVLNGNLIVKGGIAWEKQNS